MVAREVVRGAASARPRGRIRGGRSGAPRRGGRRGRRRAAWPRPPGPRGPRGARGRGDCGSRRPPRAGRRAPRRRSFSTELVAEEPEHRSHQCGISRRFGPDAARAARAVAAPAVALHRPEVGPLVRHEARARAGVLGEGEGGDVAAHRQPGDARRGAALRRRDPPHLHRATGGLAREVDGAVGRPAEQHHTAHRVADVRGADAAPRARREVRRDEPRARRAAHEDRGLPAVRRALDLDEGAEGIGDREAAQRLPRGVHDREGASVELLRDGGQVRTPTHHHHPRSEREGVAAPRLQLRNLVGEAAAAAALQHEVGEAPAPREPAQQLARMPGVGR